LDGLDNVQIMVTPNTENQPPGPSNDDEIAWDAMLAGLSQAIPIPLVDDEIQAYMQKRMIRNIIAAHHLSLSEADIRMLQTSSREGVKNKKALRSVAFLTSKQLLKRIAIKIVQKTTIVLDAKVISDAFSQTYHMGYLLDFAIRQQWFHQRSPQEIRAAIDVVCSEIDTRPVNRAVAKVFRDSASLLGTIRDYLQRVVIDKPTGRHAPETRVETYPAEANGWVEKIQTALDLMPPAYYDALADRFAAELGLRRLNEDRPKIPDV
jgi:hypothetical protein